VTIKFSFLLWQCYAPFDLLIVRYSKRNQKRSVDDWFHSLAVFDLEPLYSVPRILAEIPIDKASVVATISQGDLDLSGVRRIVLIHRLRQRRGQLLTGTRSQINGDSEQKHKLRYSCHISLFYSFCCYQAKKLAAVVTAAT